MVEETTEAKGLMVWVYRSIYSSANGGVTETHDRALLVGDNVARVTTAGDMPVLILVKRIIGGDEYLSAVPVEPTTKHRMFGGNFIYTSDGRFPNKYPIPVHDRIE